MNRRSVLALNKRFLYYTLILTMFCLWLNGCVAKKTYIDKSTGIKFIFGDSDSSSHRIKLIAPTKTQFSNTIKELQKAFNKYPKDFLIHYFEMIIIYDKMTHQKGVERAGGLNMHRRCIFIALRDGVGYVENIFHHMFNAILQIKERKSIRGDWFRCNPEGFSYWGGRQGFNYIKTHGTSQPWFDTTYLHQGFTSEYSMTSLDNDLSRYAEALFMSRKEFWDAFDKYERVRAKARLLIDLYNKLHPMFTEEYFRELGTQQEVESEK